MRIHEFAKQLNTESKKIIEILKQHNIEGKTHSNAISESEQALVLKVMKASKGTKDTPKTEKVAKGKEEPKEQSKTPKKANTPPKENSQKAEKPETKPEADKPKDADVKPVKNQPARQETKPVKKPNSGFSTPRLVNNTGGAHSTGRNNDRNRNNGQGGFNNSRNNDRNEERKHNSGQNNNGKFANNFSNRSQQMSNKPKNNGGSRGGNQAPANNSGFKNRDRNDRSNRMERNDRMERNERMERGERGRNGGKDRSNRNNRSNSFNGGGFSNKNNRNNKNNRSMKNQQPAQKMEITRPKLIKVGETIVVKDLASKISCTAADIIKKLMLMGVMATINQDIDFDTAALVAGEFGVNVEELPPEVDPTEIPEIEDDPKSLVLRPPVVTVMGHVDHGKTSLLDVIRKTSVSTSEAGGITQHIGAYQVMCQGKKIVFLDTPGHEAFTAMRARGAQVTDIAILVVAADDGVMPQTVEAINHAKSAQVPIIVAVNKIDKPGADPMRVKNELMEYGLVSEDYGGDTIMVEVSAKKRINIDELLEMILLVAEVQELKANPKRDARGIIIEAQLDKGRGPVATVLVQNGTLHIGDSIIAGTCYGKVRAMINDRGENVKKAGPSVPVEVLGLNDVPSAGDELAVLDEKLCRSIAEKRVEKQRNELIRSRKVSLDDLFQQIQEGHLKDLNILVKADVQGSVEALNSSLLSLNKNDEVRVNIIHSGVGAVTESDVMLATASNALIIAFNVRPDANARHIAETEDIDIRTYRVIYDAINDVKDAMSGMLAPKYKEVIQGRVEIREVMIFNKTLMVAGSYVLEGKITNKSKIRIVRDNIEVFDGELEDLRRFKDSVKEVAAGYECGITIKDYRDFKEGDIIEAYTMEEIETSINDMNKEE